jgi:hypothetical protein
LVFRQQCIQSDLNHAVHLSHLPQLNNTYSRG